MLDEGKIVGDFGPIMFCNIFNFAESGIVVGNRFLWVLFDAVECAFRIYQGFQEIDAVIKAARHRLDTF